MRKLHFLLVLIFATFSALGQIPNNSFEDWVSTGNYVNPQSWMTWNSTTAASGIFTASKGTPGNPGSFHLRLTSKPINSVVVGAMAVCGKFDTVTGAAISGFPFSQKPIAFTGKWQHMIYTNPETPAAQGSAKVLLTCWNAATLQREIVAQIDTTFVGMVMSWATFSFPFKYLSWKTPDSCIIILKASGTTAKNADFLYLDNLAFSGTHVGVVNALKPQPLIEMIVFPNPASKQTSIVIECDTKNEIEVQVYNLLGVKMDGYVIEKPNRINTKKLDIANYATGLYVVQLHSGNEVIRKKLVVE